MRFVIQGKFKPYVRMTQRSKWANPQARQYLNSQAAVRAQIAIQKQRAGWDMIPPQTPFVAYIDIQMPGRLHCQDLDNQIKAIIDAAQGIVFPDDRWLDATVATRRLGNHHNTVIEFSINGAR